MDRSQIETSWRSWRPKASICRHRKGFWLFWRRQCLSGGPRIPPELQHL